MSRMSDGSSPDMTMSRSRDWKLRTSPIKPSTSAFVVPSTAVRSTLAAQPPPPVHAAPAPGPACNPVGRQRDLGQAENVQDVGRVLARHDDVEVEGREAAAIADQALDVGLRGPEYRREVDPGRLLAL